MGHRLLRLTIALAAAAASAALAGAADTRSVLLLIGDDHGLEVGAYGDAVVRTPHLDRLAARGTRLTSAFATVSSCSSSRAVMLTGLHTHQNGQYGLAHAVHNQHTFDWVETLPALLRKAGVRTAPASPAVPALPRRRAARSICRVRPTTSMPGARPGARSAIRPSTGATRACSSR